MSEPESCTLKDIASLLFMITFLAWLIWGSIKQSERILDRPSVESEEFQRMYKIKMERLENE
jgi:hypothetical protein